MKAKTPRTRIAADKPRAVAHLTTDQQKALETQAEAEHATGPRRERLTRQATKLGGG